MGKMNRYVIYLIAIICVFFCISLSIVLFYKRFVPDKKIDQSDVVLVRSVKYHTIKSNLTVSDDFGKKIKEDNGSYVYYEFEVENSSKFDRNYQLYLTKGSENLENEINDNYVKFYLTDYNNNPLGIFDNNIVPTFKELKYIEDKPSSKLLYSDKIKKHGKMKFILRVWLADNYVISDENKSFSFYLDVRAV